MSKPNLEHVTTLVIIIIATVFSVFYLGHYYGRVDQGFLIAYAKKLSNPNLFPNDLLMNTMANTVPSYLWEAVAKIYPHINLELLLTSLHFIFRFLFFLGIYLLTLLVTGRKEVAYLNVFFWFTSKPSLGHEIFYNNFVQSSFTYPLLIFSSYFFLKNNYLFSFISVILAFLAHPPLTFLLVIIFFFILAREKKFNLLVKYALSFAVCVLPLYGRIQTVVSQSGAYDAAWLKLMRIRSAGHILPSAWGMSSWLPALLALLFLVIFFRYYLESIPNDILRKFKFFIFVPLVFIIISIIFGGIIPIPRVLAITPFRTSNLFSIFASIVTSLCLWRMLQNKNYAIALLGAVVSFFYFFNQYSLQFPKLFVVTLPLYITFFHFLHNNLKLLFVLLLSFTTILIPYMYKRNQLRTDIEYKKWVDIQLWAKNNTPNDSLFIVPPYLESFRLYSERPILADWKDGGAGFFSPNFLKIWWGRMEELGISRQNYSDTYQRQAYNSLTPAKAAELLKKYNAKYIIFEKQPQHDLMKKYENDYFTVYSL